jgi:hypothetical protein
MTASPKDARKNDLSGWQSGGRSVMTMNDAAKLQMTLEQ